MGLFGKRKPSGDTPGGRFGEINEAVAQTMALAQQAMATSGVDPAAAGGLAAQAGALAPSDMAAMMAYRDRSARLSRDGVEMPATIASVTLGEHSALLGGRAAQLGLTVQPPGGAPYAVSTDQVFLDGVAQQLAPGGRITVKVDPNDPQSVMIWGTGEGASPAPADADHRAQLDRLEALRERGVLSDAEFAAQKAKLAQQP
jgi:hypothetical protein